MKGGETEGKIAYGLKPQTILGVAYVRIGISVGRVGSVGSVRGWKALYHVR
ncbi:MAG: hypothetical protein F6K39_34635 [Okeania sp. SIO3B3]|nr:hypothetical protein [Okeania sp. SIO3B3]